MFTQDILRGFVRQINIDTTKLNATAAKAAIIEAAQAAKVRVLGEQAARSGYSPLYRQIVDGIEGAPLDAVRPDGEVVLAWQYLQEVAADTLLALWNRAPRDQGDYITSILVLVDGQESEIAAITNATRQVVIVPSVPYARRLEVGKRADGGPFVVQVRDHIVEETAMVARRLWPTAAKINFNYVDLTDPYVLVNKGGHRRRHGRIIKEVRYPAIIIQPLTV